MLLTLASFAFVLGVLIFVHELGHFIAAKAVGIGVPRFSIGFGPATPLRFRRGETEYVIAWIPLGGYVKMASREEQDAMAAVEGGETPEEYPEDQLFENKSLPARILVISAGVAMNILFAWLIYSAVAAVGWPEDPTTTIGRVVADTLQRALGSRSNSLLQIEVLPAPDGPLMTINLPLAIRHSRTNPARRGSSRRHVPEVVSSTLND